MIGKIVGFPKIVGFHVGHIERLLVAQRGHFGFRDTTLINDIEGIAICQVYNTE